MKPSSPHARGAAEIVGGVADDDRRCRRAEGDSRRDVLAFAAPDLLRQRAAFVITAMSWSIVMGHF